MKVESNTETETVVKTVVLVELTKDEAIEMEEELSIILPGGSPIISGKDGESMLWKLFVRLPNE